MRSPIFSSRRVLKITDQRVDRLLRWGDEVHGLQAGEWLSALVDILHNCDALGHDVCHLAAGGQHPHA